MSSARVFFQLCVKIKISQPLQQLLKRLRIAHGYSAWQPQSPDIPER